MLPALLLGNPIHPLAAVVRRALVAEVGGFEESLRGCEEWDLFLRLSRRGMRWASIDATLGDYRVHPAQSHGQTRMMLASAIHVLERFFSDPELPPVLRAVEGRAFQAAYLRGAAECYRAGLAADADRAFHAAAKARPEFLGEAASRHRRPALARGHGHAAQGGAHALSPAGPRVRGRGVPRASTLGRAAGDRATCPQATALGPRGRWSRHRRRQRAARHGRDPVSRTLLVAFGGMLGSIARYWLAGVIQRLDGVEFPFGTLGVNVLGSFIVGVVMALSLERGTLPPNARIFLAIGLCGGFTTMSTFSYETMALLRDGQAILGLGNVAATLIACLVAVWLGQVIGRIL